MGKVTCGGSPHLSCKHDQIKMRDFISLRGRRKKGRGRGRGRKGKGKGAPALRAYVFA